MNKSRYGSHTVSRLTAHIGWVTKYRYHVLKGDIQKRCRELLIQICDSEDVKILSGVVSKDHVHMHIEYAPKQSISELVKRLKGRTSRMLQSEFPALAKAILGETLLGNRIRSLVNGKHHRSDGTGILGTPSPSVKPRHR